MSGRGVHGHAASRPSWTSRSWQVNGVRLHVLRTGRERPPLIALHGLSASGACWTPVARLLEDEYDVVMPDARGHGKSDAVPGGYRYPDQAGDVLKLIEALNLTAPVLLGHSMGGMTAALVASQLGSAVRGVILADPTFLSPERQHEVYESGAAGQHRHLLQLSRSEVEADLKARHPQRSPEMVGLLAEARMQTHPAAFEVLTPPNPDHRQLIGHIRAPILLVLGGRGVVSLDTARELQVLNPCLSHELLPEAGHALVYDQPERVAAVIQAFLRSLPST